MIKKLLFENLSLKTSAVVLALILWIFVSSKGQTELSMNVPLEYMNIPPGLETARHVVRSANIVVRAHESLLKNIRREDIRVNVDVSKAKKGEGTFYIKNDDIKLPYTATVISIDPQSLKIVFEETTSKKVKINPVITGAPERDYYVKSIESMPKDIVIEGAQSEVRKVGLIKTEPIDITEFTKDFQQKVDLDLSGINIRTKVEGVDVHIKIGRKR